MLENSVGLWDEIKEIMGLCKKYWIKLFKHMPSKHMRQLSVFKHDNVKYTTILTKSMDSADADPSLRLKTY